MYTSTPELITLSLLSLSAGFAAGYLYVLLRWSKRPSGIDVAEPDKDRCWHEKVKQLEAMIERLDADKIGNIKSVG